MGKKIQIAKGLISAAASLLFAEVAATTEDWEETDGSEIDQHTRQLKFNEDGSFKILQLEEINVNGIAEDYLETQALIENLIYSERPDLIVITGDIVHKSSDQAYKGRYESAMEFIRAERIPWIWAGGNNVVNVERESLMRYDNEFSYELSWTGYKWDLDHTHYDLKEESHLGFFTGRIPIMNPAGNDEVLSIYTLDSGSYENCGESLPGASCVHTHAVEWFSNQQTMYSHNHKHRDIVFTHRPIQEFMTMANHYNVTGHKEQQINCQAQNTGLFATAKENERVGWIAAGGDFDNDFAGQFHDVYLSYGRKTGFGNEGSLLRGARVFELSKHSHKPLHLSSYIIDQDGNKNEEMMMRGPPSFTFSHQKECNVDPFEQVMKILQ